MYLTLSAISAIHLIIIFYWLYMNQCKVVFKYTNDYKEYSICYYPRTRNLRLLLYLQNKIEIYL